MFSGRNGTARLALVVVVGLVALKITVSAITGSISILAQTADSALDVFSVFLAFFAIRISNKPADEEHPFGHGKAENISAIIQALLIFTAGGLIIYSSINRIISEEAVELTEAGMAVMVVSMIASILLSRRLLKAGKATDSLALEAIGHNIAADVYSAAGVLAVLLIIRFTDWFILDPIIALAMALIIFKSGYTVIKKSLAGLMDSRLPKAEEDEIKACLNEQTGREAAFHNLRTRKAGSQRFIELTLVVPRQASVEQSHDLCDRLEHALKERLPNTSVTIHVEPCDGQCEKCSLECDLRKRS